MALTPPLCPLSSDEKDVVSVLREFLMNESQTKSIVSQQALSLLWDLVLGASSVQNVLPQDIHI